MDIKEMESNVQAFWTENNIYSKVKANGKGKKKFYFCDGPPYATGQIHPGTAWNKTMKDAYIRFYRMKGFDVRDQAGFDTHGLPIEVKVEKELDLKNKSEIETKIGVKRFVTECKAFATKYIGVMSNQFKSVGVWQDFDNPYLTFKNSFVEKSWSTIKKAHEKGLLKEELYVVPFCPRCETTSANYELEYYDKTDPSIMVKFKVANEENKFLLIWTTTPWTLPGNVAVMAHPKEDYVEVQVGNEVWIFAKARMEYVQSKVDHDMIILTYYQGHQLKGLEYLHPMENIIEMQRVVKNIVVLSDRYVTMEDGTGLVHCAPGHGPEDFMVGRENKLDLLCPVNEKGRFTEQAGKYKGLYVFDANKTIIRDLENQNLIVNETPLKHRYAHCWRCKTPLIHLATKQWFIKVSELKEKMNEEIEKTYWRPKFAKEQFKSFVEGAPDWCISRQRYWGIPLPVWKCSCGEIKVIGSEKELGVKLDDLHKPEIDEVTFKCPECSSEMRRVKDVVDVWFDSGNVIWASLENEEYMPADLILEGKDQIRGWFYSLLGSGVVNKDASPYRSVMMHGYFTDEKGEKMSKSVGNFVPLEEIIDKTSVDAFRFWSMQNVPWEDLRFNWNELNDVKRFLIVVQNMMTYMQRFYVPHTEVKDLNPEDEWLLLRLNDTVNECNDAFNTLEMYRGVRAIKKFMIEDFSRFYMKLAKKRINNDENIDAVHYVLYKCLLTTIKLMAPVAPHVSEYVYQQFFKQYEKTDSIHMMEYPLGEKLDYNLELIPQFEYVDKIVSAIGLARNDAKIKARWPIASVTVLTQDPVIEKGVMKLSGSIESLCNYKETKIISEEKDLEYGKFSKAVVDEKVTVFINSELDEKLYLEGLKNEIVRRIQSMRKTEGLVESDSIEVQYKIEKDLSKALDMFLLDIKKTVRAVEFITVEKTEGLTEWDIEGDKLYVKIKKI